MKIPHLFCKDLKYEAKSEEKNIPRKKTGKDPKEKVSCCIQAALDKKAEDLVILKVTKLSSFTDFFLICHGQSTRQVRGIARYIEEKVGEAGFEPLGVEGYREGRWVLIDYNEIIVHIFQKSTREFYDLERLWIEAPRIEIDEKKSLNLFKDGLV